MMPARERLIGHARMLEAIAAEPGTNVSPADERAHRDRTLREIATDLTTIALELPGGPRC